MKKRVLVPLLLVVALVLGIGYAALVDDLFVHGDAQFSLNTATGEFAEEVFFTAAVPNEYCGAKLDASDTSNDTVIVHIGGPDGGVELSTPQQSAVVTCTVQNDYESAVNIVNALDENDSDLADFLALYTVNIDVTGAQNIASGQTGTVVVTITPKQAFTEDHDAVAFEFPLNAELATAVTP